MPPINPHQDSPQEDHVQQNEDMEMIDVNQSTSNRPPLVPGYTSSVASTATGISSSESQGTNLSEGNINNHVPPIDNSETCIHNCNHSGHHLIINTDVGKDLTSHQTNNNEHDVGKDFTSHHYNDMNDINVIHNNGTNHTNTFTPLDPPMTNEKDRMIVRYENRINELREQVLCQSNPVEIEKIHATIDILEKNVKKMKGGISPNSTSHFDPTKSSTMDSKYAHSYSPIIHRSEIPIFQLVDDPAETKTDNVPSFENAETFADAFEAPFLANDCDLDKYWRKYLSVSFSKSKNPVYQRWYAVDFKKFPHTTSWETIKSEIIERFGLNATIDKKIQNFIRMKQGKTEQLRDYMDRYYQAYTYLPDPKPDSIYLVAYFLDSLLPMTSEEVKRSLKRYHEGRSPDSKTSFYPAYLSELFDYLKKRMGDIQESLALKFSSRSQGHGIPINKNHSDGDISHGNRINRDHKRKNNMNNDIEISSKKSKSLVNPCSFCKTENYSREHLENCVPYLKSDIYVRRRMNQQNNQNKQNRT